MDEVKILFVFDIHMSDVQGGPGYRTATYREDIFRKLWETVEIAKRENVTHVHWLGDVFDNKVPGRNSFRTTLGLADVLEAYNLPVSILVGNHDISSGSLETLEKQPLGILGRLPNVTLLQWEPLVLDKDVTLHPIPGVPLGEDWLQAYSTGSDRLRPIIVSHQLVAKDPSKYPKAAQHAFQPSTTIAASTDACLVVSGDLHTRQGVWAEPNGRGGHVGFANLGATCRMTVRDVEHKPAVLVLTVKADERRSLQFQEFPLTIRPASEVFRLEEAVEAKEYRAGIDATVQKLKTSTIHKFSIDAVHEDLQHNDTVEPGVRSMAIELLEAVR